MRKASSGSPKALGNMHARLWLAFCLLSTGSAFYTPLTWNLPGRVAVQTQSTTRPSRRSFATRIVQRTAFRMQEDAVAMDEEPSWPSDSSSTIAADQAPEVDLYQCPQCKSPILLDQNACANCGAPIETTDSFVDLTPEATSKKATESSFTSQATRNPFLSVALSQIGAQLSGQV